MNDWILILFLTTGDPSVPVPRYDGSITTVNFRGEMSCKEALKEIVIKGKGYLNGICVPYSKY